MKIFKENASLILSKMYLKHNKKRYIKIIILFSLSFSILIFILYFTMSYKKSYIAEMNENKCNLSLHMINDNTDKENQLINYIKNDNSVSNYIEYQSYSFAYMQTKVRPEFAAPMLISYPEISIDDNLFEYINTANEDCFYLYEDTSSIFDESEYEYVKKNNKKLILSGNINNLLDNELIISSKLCDYCSISYDDIIGKKISYKMLIRDYNKDVKDYYILKDYIIKAVYEETTFKALRSRPEAELYTPLGFLNINNKSMFAEIKNNAYQNDSFVYCTNIFFKDFNSLLNNVDNYINFYEDYRLSNEVYVYINYNYLIRYYLSYNNMFEISENILITISLVISFIMVLNLFNVSLYMSKRRYNYLDLCTKIGLRNKNRSKIILYEQIILFSIISIISFFLSLTISIVATYAFNLSYIDNYDVNILKIRYYFIIVILFFIFIFAIVFIMSYLIDYLIKYSHRRKLCN